MALRTEMDEAGRILVPEELRDALGLSPGSVLLLERVGDKIIIQPDTAETQNCVPTGVSLTRESPNGHRRSLRGILRNPNGPSFPTEEALDAAIEAARPEAVRKAWLAKEQG